MKRKLRFTDKKRKLKHASIAERTLSVFLAIALIISGAAILPPAYASVAWDGSATAEPTLSGDGVYEIGTAAELAWFAAKVNSGTNTSQYIDGMLTDDIDLNGKPWTPIGNLSYSYGGSFDGQGYTVSGLYINVSGTANNAYYLGLFGRVGSSGTVQGVVVQGGAVSGHAYIGAIAGDSEGTITKCANYGTAVTKPTPYALADYPVGGIVGRNSGTVSYCANTGNLSVQSQGDDYVGGIAGSITKGLITDCYNTGAAPGGYGAGGIAGWQFTGSLEIENCFNFGNVTKTSSGSGGTIFGRVGDYTAPVITNCFSLTGSNKNGATLQGTSATTTDFADGTVLATLDPTSAIWVQGNDYPVLKWETEAPGGDGGGDTGGGDGGTGGGDPTDFTVTVVTPGDGSGTVTMDKNAYEADDWALLKVEPGSNSRLASITAKSASDKNITVTPVTNGPQYIAGWNYLLTIPTPGEDVTVTVVFELATKHNITINASGSGSITASLSDSGSPAITSASAGDKVYLHIAPNSGYRLASTGVTISGATATNASTGLDFSYYYGYYWFTMPDEAITATATFEQLPTYTITLDPVSIPTDNNDEFAFNVNVKGMSALDEAKIYLMYDRNKMEPAEPYILFDSADFTKQLVKKYGDDDLNYPTGAAYNCLRFDLKSANAGGVPVSAAGETIATVIFTGINRNASPASGDVTVICVPNRLGSSDYSELYAPGDISLPTPQRASTISGGSGKVAVTVYNISATFNAGSTGLALSGDTTLYARYKGKGLYMTADRDAEASQPGITGGNQGDIYKWKASDNSQIYTFGAIAERDDVTANVTYTLVVTAATATKYGITFSQTGGMVNAVSGITSDQVSADADVVFSITPPGGSTVFSVSYTVAGTSKGTLTAANGKYTIPATNLTGETVVSIIYSAQGNDLTINTADDLIDFAKRVNAGSTFSGSTVYLGSNIDLATKTVTDSFAPIGNAANQFKGTFDGAGKTISGLAINAPSGYLGLFGYVGMGGVVKDFTVEGTVTQTSGVENGDNVGGVVGYNAGTVSGVTNKAVVSSNTSKTVYAIGGIAGRNAGIITESANLGAVSGYKAVGGIVGDNSVSGQAGTISKCYNAGAISGKNNEQDHIGGIVGRLGYNAYAGTVTNCYNTGNVSIAGGYGIGGIAGVAISGTISNCYDTGSVSGYTSLGNPLVGRLNGAAVSNSYYLSTLSGSGSGGLNNDAGTVSNVSSKTATELKATGTGAGTILTLLGNAFAADSANVNGGYPILTWQQTAPAGKHPVTVTVTPPAGVTYGTALSDPAASQTALADGTDSSATYTYHYNGTTIANVAYSSDAKPTQAGSYTVTATLVSATHMGSGTSAQFTISQKPLTDAMLSVSGTYKFTGNSITPSYAVNDGGTIATDEYTAAIIDNSNAGTATVKITAKSMRNYSGTASATFTIEKAAAPTPGAVTKAHPLNNPETGTVNIGSLLPSNKGTATYTITSASTGDAIASSSVDSSTGIYSYTTEDSGSAQTTTVNLKIEMQNYEDATLNITVSLVDKIFPAGTPKVSGTLHYGQALSNSAITVSMTDDTTAVPGSIAWKTPGFTPDAGTSAQDWVFTPTDTTKYAIVEGAIDVTVSKATPSGNASITSITQSGITLADANLTGSFKNSYNGTTVTGVLSWNDGDTTVVTANTTYKWIFTPVDLMNYQTVTGGLVPYIVKTTSSGGRSGGSNSTPSLNTVATEEKNEQSPLPSPTNRWNDVGKDVWYREAVDYTVSHQIMKGTSQNNFSPATSLTRAMMAQVLYNMEGNPATGKASFTDVNENAWYAKAVDWAALQGIVNGTRIDKFAPEGEITREQMAVMLYNYCIFKGITLPYAQEPTSFSDAGEISEWAKQAVNAMYEAGVLNGRGGNIFDPKGSATRAEVAVMLMNFMENVVNKK